jgi:hypothetical protein
MYTVAAVHSKLYHKLLCSKATEIAMPLWKEKQVKDLNFQENFSVRKQLRSHWHSFMLYLRVVSERKYLESKEGSST